MLCCTYSVLHRDVFTLTSLAPSPTAAVAQTRRQCDSWYGVVCLETHLTLVPYLVPHIRHPIPMCVACGAALWASLYHTWGVACRVWVGHPCSELAVVGTAWATADFATGCC